MEEPKERVFYGGLHVTGMCLSTHAKWQKGYFLMKLKRLAVRGTTQGTWHGQHARGTERQVGGSMCGSSEKDCGWGHSSRVSRGCCQDHLAPEGFLLGRRGWKRWSQLSTDPGTHRSTLAAQWVSSSLEVNSACCSVDSQTWNSPFSAWLQDLSGKWFGVEIINLCRTS